MHTTQMIKKKHLKKRIQTKDSKDDAKSWK